MSSNERLDEVRARALERIRSARRTFLWLVVGTGAVEAVLLGATFWFADLDDPTHRLLLCTSFLVYWTLGMGLFALGGYVNLANQRILRAIELVDGTS